MLRGINNISNINNKHKPQEVLTQRLPYNSNNNSRHNL